MSSRVLSSVRLAVASLVLVCCGVALGGAPAGALTQNERWVTRVYTEFLGRAPNSSELAWQVAVLGNGTSRPTVASNIMDSTEGRTRYVHMTYQLALGRNATSSEVTAGLNNLSTGDSYTLERGVLASTAFFNLAGGTNEAFVQELYDVLQRRAGDEAGVAYWTGELDSAAKTRTSVAGSFIRSAETSSVRVGGRFPTEPCLVTDIARLSDLYLGSYCLILDRIADATGLAYWKTHLQGTGNLLAVWRSMAASAEYYDAS
jgi:hypothetical protein